MQILRGLFLIQAIAKIWIESNRSMIFLLFIFPSSSPVISFLADEFPVLSSLLKSDKNISTAGMDVGGLGQAAGSAYVEHGRTKVVCAVNGPMEVSKRDKVSNLPVYN